MRKIALPLAALGAALIAASPVAAQYHPQSQSYGYGYGYNKTVTVWAALERRLDNVRRSLGGIRPDRAYALASETNRLDRQVRFAARNNLGAYEVRRLDARIGKLERRFGWASRGGGYNSYDGKYGNYGQREYSDHDRQGRWNGDDSRGDQ